MKRQKGMPAGSNTCKLRGKPTKETENRKKENTPLAEAMGCFLCGAGLSHMQNRTLKNITE